MSLAKAKEVLRDALAGKGYISFKIISELCRDNCILPIRDAFWLLVSSEHIQFNFRHTHVIWVDQEVIS